MIPPTIHGLSNEAYHHQAPYSEYLSSSQLKKYLISPKAFKHALDNPTEEKSDALRFGSLFHDCLEALAEGGLLEHIIEAIAVFEPPINAKTGQPYGVNTKAYKEAYDAFSAGLNGTLVSTAEERDLVSGMLNSLLYGSGSTSAQVCKLLKWGKPEVSHFIEYEGCKFKWRPDLTTHFRKRGKLRIDFYDYKSVATDDLSEDSINKIISKYGYDISAAHYQFFHKELTGILPGFYWIFVSKQPPYDCVIASAEKWAYGYDEENDIVIPNIGALKFRALLDQHIWCVKNNQWNGSESRIEPGFKGKRIMTPEPPAYENWKLINFYNNETNSISEQDPKR